MLILPPLGFFNCCCGEATPSADCTCCGSPYSTDSPGGPLQFLLDAGTITGSCSGGFPGGTCSNAGGLHYLDWAGPSPTIPLLNCTWYSPPFDHCGGTASHRWILTMGNFASCASDQANAVGLVLSQVAFGTLDCRYGNNSGTFACNALSTLHLRLNFTGGCTLPSTVTLEPV